VLHPSSCGRGSRTGCVCVRERAIAASTSTSTRPGNRAGALPSAYASNGRGCGVVQNAVQVQESGCLGLNGGSIGCASTNAQ
jgi:hypothetical protein